MSTPLTETGVSVKQAFPRLYVQFNEAPVELGDGETDPRAVAPAMRDAAVAGCERSQFAYAHMLLQGYGVQLDAKAAYSWFLIAARNRSPDALNMLGRCCELGWGIERDELAAARWYRQAAEKKHPWAQFNLASLTVRGQGVERDERTALGLLVSSARQGNAKAMNMLGRFREEGWGVQAKPASAVRWYRMAAARGCFRGQFHYARYLSASGDVDAALSWFETALTEAPEDFRRDAAMMLADHPILAVRRLASSVSRAARESGL